MGNCKVQRQAPMEGSSTAHQSGFLCDHQKNVRWHREGAHTGFTGLWGHVVILDGFAKPSGRVNMVVVRD